MHSLWSNVEEIGIVLRNHLELSDHLFKENCLKVLSTSLVLDKKTMFNKKCRLSNLVRVVLHVAHHKVVFFAKRSQHQTRHKKWLMVEKHYCTIFLSFSLPYDIALHVNIRVKTLGGNIFKKKRRLKKDKY